MGPTTRRDLKAIHRLVNQADLVLETIPNPHPSIPSARESLTAALALSKNLITRTAKKDIPQTAAEMGAKGGKKTAQRGPEYYRELAAKRKTRGGGRQKSSK